MCYDKVGAQHAGMTYICGIKKGKKYAYNNKTNKKYHLATHK